VATSSDEQTDGINSCGFTEVSFLEFANSSVEFINLAKKDASKREQLYRIPKAF
jgi:hypothetical protein